MKAIHTMGALSLAAGFLCLAACSHDQPPPNAAPGTTEPQGVTSDQNAADERIVQRIAGARCDHEMSCNNVGDGKTFSTAAVCKEQVHGSLANDLNAYNCPHGIDESALTGCLEAIRAEKCGYVFDTLSREYACRSGALCLR